jgi:hypothetical protein
MVWFCQTSSQTFVSGHNFSIICRTFVLTLSELLLKPSKQFTFFTFRKHQITIGEISVCCLSLPFSSFHEP